jgi:hypothetical protein
MCPRGVYVSVHGLVDDGGAKEHLVKDPNFTLQTFLNYFGKFFSSPRLVLKPTAHPEYSLTATFLKIKGRRGEPDYSLVGIFFSFIGGIVPQDDSFSSGYDFVYEYYYYSGEPLLVATSVADGYDLASHIPKIQEKLNMFPSLENIVVGFEQIPVSAHTNDSLSCHYESNYSGKIYFDSFKAAAPRYGSGIVSGPCVRIIVRAQNGVIENGDFIKEDHLAKAFHYCAKDFGEWKQEIRYVPPEGDDKSDVLTLYNSCDICYESVVPWNETRKHSKLAEIKIDCRRAWDVDYTFTEQMNVSSPQLMANRQYSLHVRGRVHFKERTRTEERYESESATIELSDNFNQHITSLNSPPDPETHYHATWTAYKNGQVPMKLRLVFNTYSHKYSLIVPAWEGDPVVIKGTYQWVGVPKTPDGAREFTCRAIVEELPTQGFLSQLNPDWGPDPPNGVPYKEGQTVLSGEFADVHEMGWAVGCPCCYSNLVMSPPPMPPLAAAGAGVAISPELASNPASKPWTKSVKWEIRKGQ